VTHTDTASAVVAGSPSDVFAALIDADARTVWVPPTGMSGRFEWFDARTGGGYRMVLMYDDPSVAGKFDANIDIAEARFVEIHPPSRVVEEVDFVSEDPRFAGTMTMTWTVEGVEAGTRITITARDVPDGVSSDDHATAFVSTLGNLDDYMRQQAGTAR
jgi:uncharacterized protein YndB with AHSA1/START domain